MCVARSKKARVVEIIPTEKQEIRKRTKNESMKNRGTQIRNHARVIQSEQMQHEAQQIEIDHTHDEHLRTSSKQLENIGNRNNRNSISSAPPPSSAQAPSAQLIPAELNSAQRSSVWLSAQLSPTQISLAHQALTKS